MWSRRKRPGARSGSRRGSGWRRWRQSSGLRRRGPCRRSLLWPGWKCQWLNHRGEGLNAGDYENSENGWAEGLGWGKNGRDVP